MADRTRLVHVARDARPADIVQACLDAAGHGRSEVSLYGIAPGDPRLHAAITALAEVGVVATPVAPPRPARDGDRPAPCAPHALADRLANAVVG